MRPPNLEGRIAPLLRGAAVLAGAFSLLAGGGLFFFPEAMRGLWPWDPGPFNSQFLGAIYLAGLIAWGLLAWYGRWAPARLVLPMVFVFTALSLLVSLVHVRQFDFRRSATWLWFGLHLGLLLVVTRYLWRYRQVAFPLDYPTPAGWRSLLLAHGLLLALYGIAIFWGPTAQTHFWPWVVDAFHARLYSVAFTSLALGSLGLAQFAAPVERLTLGLMNSALGLFALFGTVIADAARHSISWSGLGVEVWLVLFALEFILGLALIWWSSNPREAAS